jgi:hypothetical protein
MIEKMRKRGRDGEGGNDYCMAEGWGNSGRW